MYFSQTKVTQAEMSHLSGERAELERELEALANRQTEQKNTLTRRNEDNDLLEAWLISLQERAAKKQTRTT